jgi:phage baseplate assembly protein W
MGAVTMGSRYIVNDFLGVGWKFPIEVDETTGRIKTSSYDEDVKEAVYIILMTKLGERMMQPAFGCRVSDYIYNTMEYSTIVQLQNEIINALTLWEPRIIDTEVEIETDDRETGRFNISISYVVRQTNNPYNLVYPYYINEGLQL